MGRHLLNLHCGLAWKENELIEKDLNRMSENKTDSYSQAIDKINQLRALKFRLMDKSLTSDDITMPKILDTINMLE